MGFTRRKTAWNYTKMVLFCYYMAFCTQTHTHVHTRIYTCSSLILRPLLFSSPCEESPPADQQLLLCVQKNISQILSFVWKGQYLFICKAYFVEKRYIWQHYCLANKFIILFMYLFFFFCFTLLMAPLNMVLLRVALFSRSLVVGKVASPMLLR